MDSTTEDNRQPVALPGICARVRMPQLPNFLQPVTGGQPIALGELTRGDVATLGLALHRALARHWHDKFTARQGLKGQEAEQIGVDLVHPAIVERMAMLEAGRDGIAWGGLDQATKSGRIFRMQETLNAFAQELTTYV